MKSLMAMAATAAALLAAALVDSASGQARLRPMRLPGVDRQLGGLIWGAECREPKDSGLAFGGEDPLSEDGSPHTRVLEGGNWKPIPADLRAANPLQKSRDRAWAIRTAVKDAASRARHIYFEGLPAEATTKQVAGEVRAALNRVVQDLDALRREMGGLKDLPDYEAAQARLAVKYLAAADERLNPLPGVLAAGLNGVVAMGLDAATVQAMAAAQIDLEKAAEALDAEPPGRALSPLVYDRKSGLFVLFGGDHLDYLTNDTWVFDPAKRRWMQRHPASAPPPRAMHELAAADGKVTLTGGYTYTSNTDYCGGQYAMLGDGLWTYDVAKDAWTGPADAAGQPPDSRVYRTGPYHPDFYLAGARPDAAAFQAKLAALPANTWVSLPVLHRPRLDRVWGTSIVDPDHDLILVWCGGHSSHGGTDVLHYHLSSGRWELPYPVEFPLGQLYSNTSYPDSFNLNRRPWPTGHTYRSYGYDPVLRKMLFVGHTRHYYVYDPQVADWVGRGVKPRQMAYGGCFYDLTCCPTPAGLTAWGGYYGRREYSKISRYDAAKAQWVELPLTGDQLPGSVCDASSMVYDAKRDRLLCFVTGGKGKGCLTTAVDLKTFQVTRLAPAGEEATAAIGFLREFCYLPEHDLVLGTTLQPAGPDGVFRTPAYDCAANRWVSLKIPGPNPSGKSGRSVSLGLMYDAKRKLVWAVDNYSLQPYVLRLDPATADLKPLAAAGGG